jgi:Immunoglobulin I-set domain
VRQATFGAFAVFGVALVASGQDFTRLEVEASTDNVVWSANGMAASAGATLYFRIKATKVGPTAVAGFASLAFQPVFEWPPGQSQAFTVLPLTNAETGLGAAPNSGVPANLGRMQPFSLPSMSAASAPGLLTSFTGVWNGRSILRYSGSRNTSPTTNLAWGVQSGQASPAASGTNFNSQGSVVLFRFGVAFSAAAGGFYWVDVPHQLIASADAPAARWFTSGSGAGSPRPFLVDAAETRPFFVYVGPNPCVNGGGAFTREPLPVTAVPGRRVAFEAPALVCVTASYRWYKDGVTLNNTSRIQGTTTNRLLIDPVSLDDRGAYSCHAMFESLSRQTGGAELTVRCPSDLDNGSMLGVKDQAVTIDDLLFFLIRFEQGTLSSDIDDGSSLALPDGAVTIDDLLYFLERFEQGC